MDRIARMRAQYETELMRLDGVVGVGTIVDDAGVARLRVLTSVPPETVERALPSAVRDDVVVVHVGEIDAQEPDADP